MFVFMQSIAAIEQQFANELADLYDASEVRQLCYLLFEDRYGWSKTNYLLNRQASVDQQDITWLNTMLSSLKKARPIQYILGHAWFMGMRLTVNETVLIPRPETEELVDLIIRQHGDAKTLSLRIIDIGTGSGCIAIALKKALPQAAVYAVDISADALHTARQNAASQSVDIEFINADILEWDTVFDHTSTFDIVVSNPPYITATEQNDMHRNVLNHEPHMALFVQGNAPLLYYERIAAFATEHLRTGGGLYFEINRDYGQALCDLLHKKGFNDVALHQDIQGADRMVHAKKSITNP
ncbi:release factor glutamine methyltransferase [Parapedobacter pyrenivorans]|uniref:peptide chain release factor N(5)-glutamine methyltransferase n=2 Tax=Parapedobacter pyrenivorans TaxID=1305674 RepID=A0A917HST0_9SPHI|nr:release factor glutamine methyltransferase [Parapedobacter pyrenivorans]